MFSKATPTKKSRTARRKIALIAAASLALTTIPFALAAPAQAATTQCSVKAERPEYAGKTKYGVTLVNYKIKVYCAKARDVLIKQERWEDDYTYWPPFNGNDFLGASSWNNYRVETGKTLIINNVRTLVNGEALDEEVFHKAAIREGSRDLDIWTDWSKWSVSANLSIS